MSLNYITSINIYIQIFNEDFVNYTSLFNNAKLIINYNDSKTEVPINNVVNVKTVIWAFKIKARRNFNFFKEREFINYVDYYTWTKY